MRRAIRVTATAAATAVAAALALSLSGCSLWQDGENVAGQVQQSIAAHLVLTALTDDLNSRADVASAQSTVQPIDRTASVTVEFRASADASAIAEVATRADEAMRRDELLPYDREFSVTGRGIDIHQDTFDSAPIDYAAELAYRDAVEQATDAELTLSLGADRFGAFLRVLSTETDAVVAALAERFDAIAAVEQPDAAETMWRLPGVAGYADWRGPLPERSILAFMADMAAVTNLLDDSVQEPPPGFYAILPQLGSSHPPIFSLVANAPGTAVDAATTWQLVLRMVRGALATGLPAFQVIVQSYGDDTIEQAKFHVGDCTDVLPPTASDRKLVTDLAGAGILLPEAAASTCLAFATP